MLLNSRYLYEDTNTKVYVADKVQFSKLQPLICVGSRVLKVTVNPGKECRTPHSVVLR